MIADNLNQDTLSDNKEIIHRIKFELSKAQSEILVAMAWFTDDELLELLIHKADQGIKVSVIVAEHADNEKLDFDALDQKTEGDVIRIKNVGYGMMHQKFCVIDRKVVINGSYNWSKNAKNNHENVIVTNFPKTVEQFVETFFNIKNRAIQIMNGVPIDEIKKNEDLPENSIQQMKQVRTLTFQEQSLMEFKDVLDHIIATEVGSLDREYIRNSAYNRAKENNGDHQILPQAMDSLYSNFINEIEVVSEKKSRLKGKIDEQLKLSLGNIELKTETEINAKKEMFNHELSNLENSILEAEKGIEKSKSTIESNLSTRIPFLQSQIEKIRQKINEQKIEFVKPPIVWSKSTVLCLLICLLTAYIFVFYSSVAYIFMFSKEDIMQQLSSGAQITEMPEVFNAHAISKIWNKGVGGVLFLFLFTAIPLGLGMFEFITDAEDDKKLKSNPEQKTAGENLSNFYNRYGGILLILIVDVFIAYKVAVNINEVEYLTRVVDHRLSFSEVILNGNFWLVFVLGTLGVFLFSKVFNKLIHSVNKRNQTHQQAITKQIIVNLESDIQQFETEINTINTENDKLKSLLTTLERDLVNFRQQLQQLPIRQSDKINDLKQLLTSFCEKIINLSNIYRSQIDNDKLPISKSEMENRCNIFMEGWSKYLYEFYAIQLAESKTKDAIHEVENWLNSLHIHSELSSELKLNTLSASN